MRHRCGANGNDRDGFVVVCRDCDWTYRTYSRTAAKREAAVHRRHGLGGSEELAQRRMAEAAAFDARTTASAVPSAPEERP